MSRHSKKQEIADKVKEIKLRQNNWMKQRDETKKNGEPETDKVEVPRPSPKPSPGVKKEEKSSSGINDLLSSHKSKAKFHNWLKAKEISESSETGVTPHDSNSNNDHNVYQPSNYDDNQYIDKPYIDHRGSSDVNILRVPSTRSAGFATPDEEWNSEDETGEISTAQLMSPQNFDARTDDIIAKVKGDLAMQNRHHHTSNAVDKLSGIRHDHVTTGRHSLADVESHKTGGIEMKNHTCPTCEKLMIPPSNNPMLLIPCGHTLCGQCCRVAKFCGLCGCAIHSSTANIMLQQIITKYSKTPEQQREKSAARNAERARYKEEYQNLVTRQEILHEEANNVKYNIQKLKKKLSREHEKVENILEEERGIQTKIQELQERLRVLVEHRGEYELSCDSLHTQTKQEKNKLLMIQDSMKSIDEQMDKVRLFVEEGL